MKLARLTTGGVLFGLDLILAVLAWPFVLWFARPDILALFAPATDMRGAVYPAANLLALYAMGLYRRDAILESGRSLSRVPLVVGMGAALAVVVAIVPPAIDPYFVQPPLRDQAQLFALASVCFTLCAFATRLAVEGLLRRRVLRRRLLVVGAGQRAWDLLPHAGAGGQQPA